MTPQDLSVPSADATPTDTSGEHVEKQPEAAGSDEGQVSEAGGASLNAETSAGGADAVPDAHG